LHHISGRYAVGQNLGRGHQGWGTVISHWQSEVNYLTFGKILGYGDTCV